MSAALIQQSEEWKQMRRNKIGASDAPVIMEVSPWKTPYELWHDKLMGKDSHQTLAMKRGLKLEEAARDLFMKMTGLVVFPQVLNHPTIEWMMASLDGMDIEQKNIVEIKCANKEDHALAKNGEIPAKYFPQLQHQMEVCGLDSAFYFSFDGEKGVIVEIKRDDDYVNKMIKKEKEFWNCMCEFSPPKMTEKDSTFHQDGMWNELTAEWKEVKTKIRALERREDELKEFLLTMANGKNSHGNGVMVQKVIRKGSINYASIPELSEVNLDNYRTPHVESWRITMHTMAK